MTATDNIDLHQRIIARAKAVVETVKDFYQQPIVYTLPSNCLDYARAFAARSGKKTRYQDADLDKAVLLLWGTIGSRQKAQAERYSLDRCTVDVPVATNKKLLYGLARLLGSNYRTEFLTRMIAERKIVVGSDGYLVGERCKTYRLADELFEGDQVDWKITSKQLLARMAEGKVELFKQKIRRNPKEPWIVCEWLTAFEVCSTPACFQDIPAEFADHPTVVKARSTTPDDFYFSHKSKKSERNYSPLTTIKSEAKGFLRMPNGDPVIQFDWDQHHLTIWAKLAEDRALLQHALAHDVYQTAADWAAHNGWQWDPGSKEAHRATKDGSSIDSPRACMKKFCMTYLNNKHASNYFSKYMTLNFKKTADLVELVKNAEGKDMYLRAQKYEAQAREYLLATLVENGVEYFLDDHDGFSVGLSDLTRGVHAVESTNQKFFQGMAGTKWIFRGEKVDPRDMISSQEELLKTSSSN